jgi:hypothetical protein
MKVETEKCKYPDDDAFLLQHIHISLAQLTQEQKKNGARKGEEDDCDTGDDATLTAQLSNNTGPEKLD